MTTPAHNMTIGLQAVSVLMLILSGAAIARSEVLTEEQSISPMDAAPAAAFGHSVSTDGTSVVVGAPGTPNNVCPGGYANDCVGVGEAYVFRQDASGNWVEEYKLIASDGSRGDGFGYSIAVDGDLVVVGAPFEDESIFNSDFGAVYVFRRIHDGSWVEEAKLVPERLAVGYQGSLFGFSVAIDANTIVVGAPIEKRGSNTNSGAINVFDLAASGTWERSARLYGSDTWEGDRFGISVDISDDRIIAGAHWEDDIALASGAAYLFSRDSFGTWTQERKLKASDAAGVDHFGRSVAIDGSEALVGAVRNRNFEVLTGSAYCFGYQDGTGWTENGKILLTDGAEGDRFGFSVDVSNQQLLIGVDGRDGVAEDSGAAVAFVKDAAGSCSLAYTLLPSEPEAFAHFGYAVSVYENLGVVSAPVSDISGEDSGAVYLYDINPDPAPSVDIGLTNTGSALTSGHVAEFVVEIINNGVDPATNVALSASFPPNVDAVVSNISGAAGCTILVDRIECQIAELTAGASFSLEFQYTLVSLSSTGEIVSSVTAFADQPDANSLDNTAVASVSEAELNSTPFVTSSISHRTLTDGTSADFSILGNFNDPDGDQLIFSATGLPANFSIDASSGSISGTPIAADVGNSFVVTVTATDPFGASASDSFNIDINSAPENQAPTANAGADQSVNEGTTVNLSGSGADSDGSVVSYSWRQESGTAVTITNSNMANASFVAPMVSGGVTLEFRLTVTDDDDATSSDTVSFSINDLPATPTPIPNSSGGGGGSAFGLCLLALGLMSARWRRHRQLSGDWQEPVN